MVKDYFFFFLNGVSIGINQAHFLLMVFYFCVSLFEVYHFKAECLGQ